MSLDELRWLPGVGAVAEVPLVWPSHLCPGNLGGCSCTHLCDIAVLGQPEPYVHKEPNPRIRAAWRCSVTLAFGLPALRPHAVPLVRREVPGRTGGVPAAMASRWSSSCRRARLLPRVPAEVGGGACGVHKHWTVDTSGAHSRWDSLWPSFPVHPSIVFCVFVALAVVIAACCYTAAK